MTFFDEQGRYDVNGWLAELAELAAPHEPVAILCHVGWRSRVLSDFLDNKVGYRNIINVTGGIDAWIKGGGNVTTHR